MSAKYVVGIDLGTTHTVAAFAPIDAATSRGKAAQPRIFEVAQLTAARESETRAFLPSCLYAPLAGELEGDPDFVVGELARRRGAEVAGRFVGSAKSWLSHAAVDRLAPILPWGKGDDDGAPKISPVDASARVLAHLRDAWNRDLPDAPLAEQEVVITLPASFDEVARELTLKAAEIAGLSHVTLLEEPTAAFYDVARDGKALRELLGESARDRVEKSVLVCDVGGGTTDLSLMIVRPDTTQALGFSVKRVAVGRHILLGGDNMDLALAHLAESRLGALDAIELLGLVASCRDAKERILAGTIDEARVTVLGRGGKLVGGARSTTLSREEVERVVLGGFFPKLADAPEVRRGAIVAFGLPYERDPAITRHIRQFLARHGAELPGGAPDAVLLNGGVFHAKAIVRELLASVASLSGGVVPETLPSADPDLAVARGAVLFAFARRGIGLKVESGASRGYYVALAESGSQKRAVCILPRGASEGVRHEAAGRTFELVVGRNVRFELYASDTARDDAGVIVAVDEASDESEKSFERLPPLVARLPASEKETSVTVTLGAELLPTGQLEIACAEAGGSHRKFRLEFQLREAARTTSLPPPPASIAPRRASTLPPKMEEGARIVAHVFGKKAGADPRETKDVVRDLEKALGDRASWTMDLTRSIADQLLTNPGARRRTAAHERAFFMLLGFCLRPGFGDPGDAQRIERTWPLFEGRLAFPDEARGWQQFFIAWRRMSGGLSEAMQLAIRDAMDPVIAPSEAHLKKPKRMPEMPDELFATLSALERVPVARRVELGEWLLERTWTTDDPRIWAAIGRIGARAPLYASVHHVVPPAIAEKWIERLLRAKWESIATAPHAAVQLARVTGDRARDVSERLRGEVGKRLAASNAKETWVQSVRELVEVAEDERVAILGESLPIGLRLSP